MAEVIEEASQKYERWGCDCSISKLLIWNINDFID